MGNDNNYNLHNHAKNLSSSDLMIKRRRRIMVSLEKQLSSEKDSKSIKFNLDKNKIKSVHYVTYFN